MHTHTTQLESKEREEWAQQFISRGGFAHLYKLVLNYSLVPVEYNFGRITRQSHAHMN